jgi:membrane protein YqaA with SNARE-associated domain
MVFAMISYLFSLLTQAADMPSQQMQDMFGLQEAQEPTLFQEIMQTIIMAVFVITMAFLGDMFCIRS